jgi:hypothetical protein
MCCNQFLIAVANIVTFLVLPNFKYFYLHYFFK